MAEQQIEIGAWKKGLAQVFESNTIGGGAVALLQVLNLQLGQANEMIATISADAFVQRDLDDWRKAYTAANFRLGWMIARLKTIVDGGADESTRALEIWNFIGAPVLQGRYPAEMAEAFAAGNATAGITPRNGKDWSEGGQGFGEAFAAATLWNQAAVASNFAATQGSGWAHSVVAGWLTETARQLERTAPGEKPTIADATVVVLRRLAAAPGDLLRAVGLDPWLIGLGVGLTLVTLFVLTRR